MFLAQHIWQRNLPTDFESGWFVKLTMILNGFGVRRGLALGVFFNYSARDVSRQRDAQAPNPLNPLLESVDRNRASPGSI